LDSVAEIQLQGSLSGLTSGEPETGSKSWPGDGLEDTWSALLRGGKWAFSGSAVLGGDMDASARPHSTHTAAPGLQLTNSHHERNKLFLLLPSAHACQEGKTLRKPSGDTTAFPGAGITLPWYSHNGSAQSQQERAVV